LYNTLLIQNYCKLYPIFFSNTGTAYYRIFKFNKAELCHHYHLQLSKPNTAIGFGDKRPANKKEERIALTNLGCVYHAKREFELALQTYKKAFDLGVEVSFFMSMYKLTGDSRLILIKTVNFLFQLVNNSLLKN